MSRRSCDLDHEIFQCVYRLKEKPQVPSIDTWQWDPGRRHLGSERHGPGYARRSTTWGSTMTRAG